MPNPNEPFKFIYFSGKASSSDPSAALWFNAMGRRSRGEAENAILEFGNAEAKGIYQGFVLRPGLVYRREWMCLSLDYSIPLEWLARAVLGLAKGSIGKMDGSRKVENQELVEWGRKLVRGAGE
jgi:hypothetical protein